MEGKRMMYMPPKSKKAGKPKPKAPPRDAKSELSASDELRGHPFSAALHGSVCSKFGHKNKGKPNGQGWAKLKYQSGPNRVDETVLKHSKTLDFISQIWMVIFGCAAIRLLGRREDWRRWGYITDLVSVNPPSSFPASIITSGGLC